MEKAQIYRGIEFVRISDLSVDQKETINHWLTNDMIIKILKNDDQLLVDCIQYKHYEDWYNNVFSAAPQEETSKAVVKTKGFKAVRLVIGR